MQRYIDLVNECLNRVRELFPWDLVEKLGEDKSLLLLDVREKDEFETGHIAGSVNIPRGILESACEYGYEETVPELVQARQRTIVVVCRSGYRSALAADTMTSLGFADVMSLKTGLRGWNDYEQSLVDAAGETVDVEQMDKYFAPNLSPAQRGEVEPNSAVDPG